jgi:hypothetical protein
LPERISFVAQSDSRPVFGRRIGLLRNDRHGWIPDRRRSVVEWRDCAESDQ